MDKRIDSRNIIKIFQLNALGGKKTPHGVSNPVFRRNDDGNIEVAAFIYLYKADELRSGKLKRPSRWITVDLKNTEHISEFSCLEKDFCDIASDTVCELAPEENTIFSAEYSNQTLAIFDLVLKKYLVTGKFDKELNDAYMDMMLKMVSVGFKPFYRALNNV